MAFAFATYWHTGAKCRLVMSNALISFPSLSGILLKYLPTVRHGIVDFNIARLLGGATLSSEDVHVSNWGRESRERGGGATATEYNG